MPDLDDHLAAAVDTLRPTHQPPFGQLLSRRRARRARRTATAVASAAVAVAAVVTATVPTFRSNVAELAAGGGTAPADVRIRPERVETLGPVGDPQTVTVWFPYTDDNSFCSNQFVVTATETDTEVRIGDVVNQVANKKVGCFGIGTMNGRAWVHLKLRAPLGQRRAVYAGELGGPAELPVVRFP